MNKDYKYSDLSSFSNTLREEASEARPESLLSAIVTSVAAAGLFAGTLTLFTLIENLS